MVTLLLFLACGEEVGDASFGAVRDDILLPSCGFSSCHGGGSGGLTLDPEDPGAVHAALVNAPSTAAPGQTLVLPGDPDGSYLVMKLEGGSAVVGDVMPPPSGGLDAGDVAVIRAWIADGAAAE